MVRMKEVKKGITGGITAATQQYIIPTVDAYIATKPEWTGPWIFVRGLIGSILQLRQDKINWFLEEVLEKNSNLFTKDLLESEDFQISFLTTIENILKQRHKEKEDLIAEVFLGYTVSENKKNFNLERLQNTISLISLESIEFLKFYIEEIAPGFLDERIDSPRLQSMSEAISKYQVNYNHSFDKIMRFHPERVAELTSLGLVRSNGIKMITSYDGESQLAYDFTGYGIEFLYYLKNKKN